jgi:hypothetical protein
LEVGRRTKAEISSYDNLCFEFGARAACVAEELNVLALGGSPITFRDVACDGDCGTAHLVGEAELFRLRKGRRQLIDFGSKLDGVLPYEEIFE